jgi:hypothetical protein
LAATEVRAPSINKLDFRRSQRSGTVKLRFLVNPARLPWSRLSIEPITAREVDVLLTTARLEFPKFD